MLRILERIGIQDVTVVPEQAEPTGTSHLPLSNPSSGGFAEGLELCEKVQPDLLLATTGQRPVGIAVKQGGEFKLMTGNEVGILLLDFIARVKQEQGKLPAHPVAVTTIVSTDMVDPIAQHYGVEMRRCLTGFKYIGDIIAEPIITNNILPKDQVEDRVNELLERVGLANYMRNRYPHEFSGASASAWASRAPWP